MFIRVVGSYLDQTGDMTQLQYFQSMKSVERLYSLGLCLLDAFGQETLLLHMMGILCLWLDKDLITL